MFIYLQFIGLIVVWALSWPFAKIGLQYLPPLWFVCIRVGIGMITMFGLLAIVKKLRFPKKEDLFLTIWLGILQIGLFTIFTTIGLYYVSAGQSAILTYTTPIWVIPVAIVFFNERIRPLEFLGLLFGILGIIVVFNPWHHTIDNAKVMFGNFILLFSAILWSISILIARYSRWYSDPLLLIPWQLLIAFVICMIAACFFEPYQQSHFIWSKQLLITLFYCGCFATAYGYWSVISVNKNLSPIVVSSGMLVTPVISMLSSVVLVNEPLTLHLITASSLVILGLLAITFARHKAL